MLGALLYLPAVGAGRLADDFVLLRTVRRVTNPLWPFGHNDLGQPPPSGHFYRPLWVLWNAAVYQVSHDPAVAHVANLLLFAVVCAEVVLLLRVLAGERPALIGGVLFAVFPTHGESVAWISGNTDVLATALGLAALLTALTGRPTRGRDLAVGLLAAAAMLAKEIAVVLPVLLLIASWSRGSPAPPERRRLALVMLGAVVVALLVRGLVVNGVGGYGTAFTAKRAIGSVVSFTLGALSAPQLRVLAHPALLAVPLCLLALIVGAGYYAWRRERTRLAVGGLAWFLVAIVPVLNQPLNLNTGNGNRLLLLPSVGLVLSAATLLARLRSRFAAMAAATVAAVLCGLCVVLNAIDWNAAGTESRRLLADIARIAPRDGRLAVLSVPAAYRQAHLYPDALDAAVQESGRPDVTLTLCIPAQALALRAGQVTFHRRPDGVWIGRASSEVPFDIPVLSDAGPQASNGCRFGKAPGQRGGTLGTARTTLVTPLDRSSSSLPIYFDGRDMRRAAP